MNLFLKKAYRWETGKLYFNLAFATYMPLTDSLAFLFGRQKYCIQTFLSSTMQAVAGVYGISGYDT